MERDPTQCHAVTRSVTLPAARAGDDRHKAFKFHAVRGLPTHRYLIPGTLMTPLGHPQSIKTDSMVE